VVLQACGQCHNARLDQTLSRASFRADLDGMTRAAKDTAIARLKLPLRNPLAMPPPLLRVLTPKPANARSRCCSVKQRWRCEHPVRFWCRARRVRLQKKCCLRASARLVEGRGRDDGRFALVEFQRPIHMPL